MRSPRHAFFRALAFSTGFEFLPAIYQRISGVPMRDGALFFWFLPGGLGALTAALLLGLLFEAWQQRNAVDEPALDARAARDEDAETEG